MKSTEEIKAGELIELQSLRAKAAKPDYKGYLIVIMIIAVLIHSVDEIVTNVTNNIKSSIITEYFVVDQGMTFNEGLSVFAALGMVGVVIMLIAPFYKALSDKFGRKIFLVINTLGLALAMVIMMLSQSFLVYFVGFTIGTFFTAHDMQVIYILEIAPSDKRTRFYGITKAIGTLGFVLLPLMRSAFMGNDPTRWRLVFIVPIIVTVIISIIALFFARESQPFLKNRIEYLETPYEERHAREKQEKEEKKANAGKSGVFSAMKYIWKVTELKWILIIVALYYLCVAGMSQYFEPIMYAANMSTEDITRALFMYGFMFAAVILLAGFMGDLIGRKVTAITFGLSSIILFILFVFSANNGWNPYLVGTFYGLYLGCFWQGGDYLIIITSEKMPTNLRASGMSVMGLLLLFGAIVGNIIMAIALLSTSISMAVLLTAVPCIGLSMLLLALKVKETKGVDLATIGNEIV